MIATLTLIALPAAAAQEGPFGAIAYSTTYRNSYIVTDYQTQAEAEAAALKSCRDDTKNDPSCAVALWFKDACGALAKASDGSWGTGWGSSQDLASRYAVETCRDYGGTDCKMKIVACSPGGAMTIPAN